jgi:hypothetical protein
MNRLNDCNCGLHDEKGVEAQKILNEKKGDAGGLTFLGKVANNPVPLLTGIAFGGATAFLIPKLLKRKK